MCGERDSLMLLAHSSYGQSFSRFIVLNDYGAQLENKNLLENKKIVRILKVLPYRVFRREMENAMP